MNKPHFFVEGIPYYSFFLYDAIHPLIGDETLKKKLRTYLSAPGVYDT